jgi:hypothetical protein
LVQSKASEAPKEKAGRARRSAPAAGPSRSQVGSDHPNPARPRAAFRAVARHESPRGRPRD